jgi:hypothetical protein
MATLGDVSFVHGALGKAALSVFGRLQEMLKTTPDKSDVESILATVKAN